MTTIRFSLFGLVALALPMSTVACSESGPSHSTSPSASTASPSPGASATPAPEDIADPFEAAIAAYLRFRDVLDEAAAVPDPNHPELEAVAADEGLEIARTGLQRLADEGLQNTGKHTDEFEIKDWAPEENPTQIVLITCSDSSATLVVEADTGEPIEDEEYGKRHVEALVELRDGRWLITDLAVRELGSCLPHDAASRPARPEQAS